VNRVPLQTLGAAAGHYYAFCCDQTGSRFLQTKVSTASPDEFARFFDEIAPHLSSLIRDRFGNYVIQKILPLCTSAQIQLITQPIWGSVAELALDTFACCVVQKSIDHLMPEQRLRFARELFPVAVRCTFDQNANHGVQRCIVVVPSDELEIVFETLLSPSPEIFASLPLPRRSSSSRHTYGCRVMQKLMDRKSPPQKERLIAALLVRTMQLAVDQYGN
jgi:hypothetical protein